jgi:hypothetical protein
VVEFTEPRDEFVRFLSGCRQDPEDARAQVGEDFTAEGHFWS